MAASLGLRAMPGERDIFPKLSCPEGVNGLQAFGCRFGVTLPPAATPACGGFPPGNAF